MNFKETKIKDVYLIELQKREDERGFLTRIFGAKEFEDLNIPHNINQGYISHTNNKGTIRGLHYQIAPTEMTQLTRVLKGAIYEVVIDLRPDSPTYLKWLGFEIKASDFKSLYIPENIAHGILILENDTEFMNLYSKPFTPECEMGIRYNDPLFNISWPIPIEHVSDKDKSWPNFKNESLK